MEKCQTDWKREHCVGSAFGAQVLEQPSHPTEARSANGKVSVEHDMRLDTVFLQ